MQRLYAVPPEYVQDYNGFESPALIEPWVKFLALAIPFSENIDTRYKQILLRNLGHRLQYLEFTHSLILFQNERPANSLHSSVYTFQILSYATTLDSFFEGLGAHLHRRSQPTEINQNNCKIPAPTKIAAAASFIDSIGIMPQKHANYFLWFINKIRNKVHFDQKISLDFNEISRNDFLSMAIFLKTFLTGLPNQSHIPETSLIEEFPDQLNIFKARQQWTHTITSRPQTSSPLMS